jgi:hypothetical protein
MSKNIYRVNKKSDVDIIFKNNLLKPIFLIFTDNKTDTKLVDEIEKTLLVLSKKNTYGVSLIINFDKFTDEMNFFNQYKEVTPSFVSFFLGQQITEYSNNDCSNFISIIVSIIEKIHLSYVNKLNTLFTADEEPQMNTSNISQLEQPAPTQPQAPIQPQPQHYEEEGGDGDDNDTDEIRLKKEKLKLLLKQKELLEIQKN